MNPASELHVALPHLALSAQAWGDPSAPTLLALHGWLDNAASFATLAPLLTGHFRVIALDLPGHGRAAHLPAGAGYQFIDYVRAVLAAADALQLDRYTLLGHSLGAGVASLAAAATPQRIDHLLLIEGLGPLADDGTHTLQRFRDALAADSGARRRPQRVFASIEQAVSARSMASGLRGELARPIIERALQQTDGGWRWRSDPRLTRASALRMAETQVRALLQGIEAPTALLLARPATVYLPTDMMRERAASVPHMAISQMDGGHHLHLEHPQAVADWIMASGAT